MEASSKTEENDYYVTYIVYRHNFSLRKTVEIQDLKLCTLLYSK